jgi:hypothetical protein
LLSIEIPLPLLMTCLDIKVHGAGRSRFASRQGYSLTAPASAACCRQVAVARVAKAWHAGGISAGRPKVNQADRGGRRSSRLRRSIATVCDSIRRSTEVHEGASSSVCCTADCAAFWCVRVWLAAGATKMRRGFDGLSRQVRQVLGQDPFGGG